MQAAGAKPMGGGGAALLAVAAITWVILTLVLKSVVGVDAPGDRDIFLGLRWVLAYLLICALWLWLGLLLLTAGGPEAMPKWASVAAIVLIPASAIAALAGLYLVEGTETRWPLVVILTVPPLVAFYFFALHQSWLRAAIGRTAGTAVIWGMVLVMSGAVFPALARRLNDNAQRAVENTKAQAAWEQGEKQRKHDEALAKLKTMTPDQHLTEWYSLLDPENGVRDEALVELRKVDRRQGDVEEGLGYGIPAIMRLVPDLDLKPTPELCAAGRAYLKITADRLALTSHEPAPFAPPDYIEWNWPGIRWFQAHGCNCQEGVAALDAAVRTYSDSPDRQRTLEVLAGLKQGR